ncbi:MAG: threonine synthase [Spirochaetales bacterium]|nr:threonine synthase [Spirochaetales bacterium]
MRYISTRANWKPEASKTVIRLGMVPDGGLFVPEVFPAIDMEQVKKACSYKDCAFEIMKQYLSDFEEPELRGIIDASYGNNFNSPDVAPVYRLDDTTSILELWHGPTAAFKDIALQCMPRLLIAAMRKESESLRVMILVATSGDTGKAALEGFRDVEGTTIITFYPSDGVSSIQKQQMVTTEGQNTAAVGVRGNFDDCQTSVKNAFQDRDLRKAAAERGIVFSSANSINWGRLVPQITYYFWAYRAMHKRKMIGWKDGINICVPTGNFGNILAAYYAYKMGLPVNRLICASNMNNILTDFINTGTYNINRTFYSTVSPSMDILISSNLERLIFDLTGRDGGNVEDYYGRLKRDGSFSLTPGALNTIRKLFYGGFASEDRTYDAINRVYHDHSYVLDTHTAVGYHVLCGYRKKTGDMTPAVLTSTANPYKFPVAVYRGITGRTVENDFEALSLLHERTGLPVHPCLSGIEQKKVTCTDIIAPDEIGSYIEKSL